MQVTDNLRLLKNFLKNNIVEAFYFILRKEIFVSTSFSFCYCTEINIALKKMYP